ncbi:MAG: molybdopterin converting factor subunit 1 [Burkholderiales bacterium]
MAATIRVLYFARLREQVGRGEETLALPPGIADIGSLRAHLAARGGAWAEALASTRLVRAAVNQDMADGVTPVKDGDEIAFFPPVTGG